MGTTRTVQVDAQGQLVAPTAQAFKEQNGLAQAVQHNPTGTGVPNVSNDGTEGYSFGSIWVDTSATPAEIYKCVDAATGAAQWINTSLTLDDLGSMAVEEAGDYVGINDERLSNSRDPNAHASTHSTGGSDPVTAADVNPAGTAIAAALGLKLNANDASVTNSREWTADTVEQAEAETGTATTRRAWTAQRVRQAINAVAVLITGNQTVNGVKSFNNQITAFSGLRSSGDIVPIFGNQRSIGTSSARWLSGFFGSINLTGFATLPWITGGVIRGILKFESGGGNTEYLAVDTGGVKFSQLTASLPLSLNADKRAVTLPAADHLALIGAIPDAPSDGSQYARKDAGWAVVEATSPISTNTNTTKLALTGIQPGQEVLVTQEANRLEKYIGGDTASDNSWLVLRNSVHLFAKAEDADQAQALNGVEIFVLGSTTGAPTDCGWVRVGDIVPCYGILSFAPLGLPKNFAYGTIAHTLISTKYWHFDEELFQFVLPDIFEDRGEVSFYVTF